MDDKRKMIVRYIDDHPRDIFTKIFDDETTIESLRTWLINESGISVKRQAYDRLAQLKDAGIIDDRTTVASLRDELGIVEDQEEQITER